jgi:hypothetical protein
VLNAWLIFLPIAPLKHRRAAKASPLNPDAAWNQGRRHVQSDG